MLPRAILFDLDNTLVHRAQSIESYAKRFLSDFANHLEHVAHEAVSTTILRQDNGGYLDPGNGFKTIKEAVAFGLFSTLSWRKPTSAEDIKAHWVAHIPKHTV